MQNIINNIKRNYLLSIIVIGLIVLSLYSTFAMFTAGVSTNDIVNLSASNIPTGTELVEYERLTIGAGEKKTIEFTVKNSTGNSLYYGAWYEMVKPTSINDDIQIAKLKDTQNDSLGQLTTGSNAKVSLVIVNDSSSSIIVNIGVAYSSTSSLNLPTNRYLITETYNPKDLIINTTDMNKFNNRGTYTVNINCTNATARWDYTNWKLVVSSLNGTICNPTFTDRSDNLSQYIINNAGTTQGDGQIVKETVGLSSGSSSGTNLSESEYIYKEVDVPQYNEAYFYGDRWQITPSTGHENKYELSVKNAGYYEFCYSAEPIVDMYVDITFKDKTYEIREYESSCFDMGYSTQNDVISILYDSNAGSPTFGNDTFYFYIKTSNKVASNAYRYEGKNPNNYVLFNGELWRIIGVFDSTTHGVSSNLTKIIRNESIGSYAWHKSSTNDWSSSSLNTILNTYYYNSGNGTGQDACYFYSTSVPGNCDFRYTGLDATARGMVQEVTWKLGGYSGANATAESFYGYERGTTVYRGRPTTATGYIGLMYPSDYGYSALSSSCARTTNLSSYDSSTCGGQSWLLKNGGDWTMTPVSSYSSGMFFVSSKVYLSYSDADSGSAVRPTAYLKSSVYIVSGDGSQANPYILGN